MLQFAATHWFAKKELLKSLKRRSKYTCTPSGTSKATAIFWGPKKKNLTLWLVRGSKCAQDHGECSYSSLGALKIGVWKRYSKNRFFRPKMPIFGPKTLSNRLLRSPILMKSFSRVLFSPIIHPQFWKLKKKAIRCPKTQKIFKETSYLSIVGCKTQVEFILESWNLYCTCNGFVNKSTNYFDCIKKSHIKYTEIVHKIW